MEDVSSQSQAWYRRNGLSCGSDRPPDRPIHRVPTVTGGPNLWITSSWRPPSSLRVAESCLIIAIHQLGERAQRGACPPRLTRFDGNRFISPCQERSLNSLCPSAPITRASRHVVVEALAVEAELAGGDGAAAVVAVQGAAQATLLVPEAAELWTARAIGPTPRIRPRGGRAGGGRTGSATRPCASPTVRRTRSRRMPSPPAR
jgi:hypothetical protein